MRPEMPFNTCNHCLQIRLTNIISLCDELAATIVYTSVDVPLTVPHPAGGTSGPGTLTEKHVLVLSPYITHFVLATIDVVFDLCVGVALDLANFAPPKAYDVGAASASRIMSANAAYQRRRSTYKVWFGDNLIDPARRVNADVARTLAFTCAQVLISARSAVDLKDYSTAHARLSDVLLALTVPVPHGTPTLVPDDDRPSTATPPPVVMLGDNRLFTSYPKKK